MFLQKSRMVKDLDHTTVFVQFQVASEIICWYEFQTRVLFEFPSEQMLFYIFALLDVVVVESGMVRSGKHIGHELHERYAFLP